MRSRASSCLVLASLTIGLIGACDRDQDDGEPVYAAECDIAVGPADWPPIHEAQGQGVDRDTAYGTAFAQACGMAGLGPGCQDDLPDNVRTNRVGCVSVTMPSSGTGGALTAESSTTGFTCTVRVIDERNPVRFEGRATFEGSREETEDLAPLCLEATASACTAAGAEAGCTEGDEPAWRIVSSSEGRTAR